MLRFKCLYRGNGFYTYELFFISVLCVFGVLGIVSASFLPVDKILINCGGFESVEADSSRVFEPDTRHSGVTLYPESSIVVSKGVSNLYDSARVFEETSKYIIVVKKSGRHWLRLHFQPVQDAHYNLKGAVFSVVSNGATLLHDFSFYKLGRHAPLLKEYVIEVGGSSSKDLVLDFSPSVGSIAFINGIEVLSVPGGLFHSSASLVPLGSKMQISDHVVLETVYRINVGAPVLTPKNDALSRVWEVDQHFLMNPSSARNVSAVPSLIKYPAGISQEVAPNWVYATAREMANANVSDQMFNISWAFVVDPGFSYLVRLHFCDIVSAILDQLSFNVYINNQSALNSFDISRKTLSLSAAYFVDFVANVSCSSSQVLVQVGPSHLRNFPSNAILNGLEIVKLSDQYDNLDRDFHEYMDSKTHKEKRRRLMLAIICSLSGFSAFMLILAVLFLYFCRQKKPKHRQVSWTSLPSHTRNFDSRISARSFVSAAQSLSLGRSLTFAEICEATNNFEENLFLGAGGFGKVYKGVLENGVMIAVKRGSPHSNQGLTEFKTEIEMLSKLRHIHLVSLIGYCEELNEMILVYEYMAGGPLRRHLYGSKLPPLTWKQRLEICIGAAKGLHYLHTGAAESIIHRDVKTTNILLDENLIAKVADFGLSKQGPTLDQTHVSTAVKGSFGYLDPEYFRRQQLTEKSDVYSFGVVLMEVLCARPAINPSLPREQVNIAEWTMSWQKKGQLEKIIDPHLMGCINTRSLRKFGETAEKCLQENGSERPSMGDVLWNLEYALRLQEASVQTVPEENSANYIADCIPRFGSLGSNIGNGEIESEQYQDVELSSKVFSQLISSKGR